jgi:hypothetical protein
VAKVCLGIRRYAGRAGEGGLAARVSGVECAGVRPFAHLLTLSDSYLVAGALRMERLYVEVLSGLQIFWVPL